MAQPGKRSPKIVLERRLPGLACLQTGRPLSRPGAHFPGPDVHLRCGSGIHRPVGLDLRIDHEWQGVPEASGGESGGRALCGLRQSRVADGKERLPQPLTGQSPVARPSLTQPGRLKKPGVQETGCGKI